MQKPTIPKPQFKYDIPKEKVNAVGEYIIHLQNKYPKMSKSRVMRKAAEYFKLKLQ